MDYYYKFAKNIKTVQASYHKTVDGRKSLKNARAKYVAGNPEKFFAKKQMRLAIKTGKIKKGSCEVCGSSTGVHGHHEDYSKPLMVKWLCHACHRTRHKELKKELRPLPRRI